MSDTNADLARACYAAFFAGDRPAMETLLAGDFTFTSPRHDHISRAAFFERCWPAAGTFESFEVRSVVEDGDASFALYGAVAAGGEAIRNVERVRCRDGEIVAVEVFFGGRDARRRLGRARHAAR